MGSLRREKGKERSDCIPGRSGTINHHLCRFQLFELICAPSSALSYVTGLRNNERWLLIICPIFAPMPPPFSSLCGRDACRHSWRRRLSRGSPPPPRCCGPPPLPSRPRLRRPPDAEDKFRTLPSPWAWCAREKTLAWAPQQTRTSPYPSLCPFQSEASRIRLCTRTRTPSPPRRPPP